ncbi:hypothetical protein ID866_10422, partial [Astraeus odoratus]
MIHYLLPSTPLNVVKTMGHWSGETFHALPKKHAVILAP